MFFLSLLYSILCIIFFLFLPLLVHYFGASFPATVSILSGSLAMLPFVLCFYLPSPAIFFLPLLLVVLHIFFFDYFLLCESYACLLVCVFSLYFFFYSAEPTGFFTLSLPFSFQILSRKPRTTRAFLMPSSSCLVCRLLLGFLP